MLRMITVLGVLLAAAAGLPARALAEAGPAGTWRVQFVVPSGTKAVTMNVQQKGSRLTGVVTDEYGEYPLDGRVDADQVTIAWSIPEDGKLIDITMKGKLQGNLITGTAKIGDLGEGALEARRTADE